jgi:hypothetical protein
MRVGWALRPIRWFVHFVGRAGAPILQRLCRVGSPDFSQDRIRLAENGGSRTVVEQGWLRWVHDSSRDGIFDSPDVFW